MRDARWLLLPPLLLGILVLVACSSGSGAPSGGTTGVPAASDGGTRAASSDNGRSVLSGAGPDERTNKALSIAAASDLRRVLVAMQPEIERSCDTKLTFVFGSSGQLKEQILAGANYHLFLSADTGFVEELARAGRIVPNGSTSYTVGRIALAWRNGLPPVRSVSDLARGDIRRIAIANPGHAPYGRAAQEAMETAGVWDGLQGRLVLGENIRQTTDYVQQGNVDAAIVALALVIDTDTAYELIPANEHKPLIQGGGVVRGTGGELTARCVMQYLLDPAGQETLLKYGFEPVPGR
jgi:molybdate transport system substrate-binding protein